MQLAKNWVIAPLVSYSKSQRINNNLDTIENVSRMHRILSRPAPLTQVNISYMPWKKINFCKLTGCVGAEFYLLFSTVLFWITALHLAIHLLGNYQLHLLYLLQHFLLDAYILWLLLLLPRLLPTIINVFNNFYYE